MSILKEFIETEKNATLLTNQASLSDVVKYAVENNLHMNNIENKKVEISSVTGSKVHELVFK